MFKPNLPTKDPEAFPMRINKFLAMKGYATRRGADELIQKRIVTINGRLASLGDKVKETDVVEVRKNKKAEEYVYYACNKPRGINTLDTRKDQKSFSSTLPIKRVFPVGSLDKEATGLIIFTNDRRIVARLEDPSHHHERQYFVETIQPLRTNFKDKLEAGVSLEGGPLLRSKVELKSPNSAFVTIADQRNQLRQICSLFGAEISKLTRTSILNIRLGGLKPNDYRKIEGQELETFLRQLGL